ncbi:hypothetical protein JTB14_025761 [Gonioctena quinquepunctata]|nr:hypothetical protein JTB14_025761 [Gonioctena quinquepunctata]
MMQGEGLQSVREMRDLGITYDDRLSFSNHVKNIIKSANRMLGFIKEDAPQERAGILSRITFLYTKGIFWRTYKNGTMDEGDLYAVLSKFRTKKLGDELEKHMEKDINKHGVLSVYRLLWSCYGYEYLIIGFIQLLMRSLVIVAIPITLSKVVLYFQPGQEILTKREAIVLATLLILLNFLSITYIHNYLLHLVEMGIRIRTAFCSVMYRKCLKLTSSSLSEITVGKIITLMTKDVTALELTIFYGNDTWIGFTQAAVVCYMIYYRMGLAAFVGIGFLCLAIPVQIYFGKMTKNLREHSCKKTDERLQTTQETLSAIKIVKMYVWEHFFERKINDARRAEMHMILKIYLTKIIMVTIGILTSRIAFYLLLMTYLWFGQNVSAELIYYITTLFLRIRHALNVAIPVGITTLAELHASVRRIEHLMNAKDLSRNMDKEVRQDKARVNINNVTLRINETNILENLTLTVGPGLTFLNGPLGCGKTSLLKTISGEYDDSISGSNNTRGSISYASQEPWIFPSTLRQNIIFEQEFDQQRYDEILRVCDLHLDIRCFPEGDEMMIGGKGANLSKGQRARINLARAAYKNADIYLLDDCITSLDPHVQKNVFQKCIREFLVDKICILVTQNLENFLPNDNLISIQNGKIILHEKVNPESDRIEQIEYIPIRIDQTEKYKGAEVNNNICDKESLHDSETTSLLNMNKTSLTKNIYSEVKKSGKVPWSVYAKYIRFGGGYLVFSTIVFFFLGTQFANSYTEKILSNWIDDVHETHLRNDTIGEKLSSSFTVMYSSLMLATMILSTVTSFLFFNFTRKSSVGLHKSMVESTINAVMQFFDNNPIGTILNRFSNDLRIIDEMLPSILFDFLEILFGTCGIIILLASVNMIFLIPTVIISIVLFYLRKLYIPTGRNLQRLDATTRSPVMGYLNASLEGLPTIRAFQAEPLLAKEFDAHQDLYVSANYTSKCCQRAFGYALDVCCTAFIAIIIGLCLVFDKGTSVGDVGLVITQAFTLTSVVQYGIRQWAEIESKITSVERVLEYTETPNERVVEKATCSWPQNNSIVYDNVSLRYNNREEYILKDLNFTINDMEKIVVVGRTGAGKSSIISILFRLYDYEGRITIGGVDINDISLETLRSNITIIPQDPVLFSGTIRSNIDPTGKYDDDTIWKAIGKAGLKHLITSLSTPMADTGSNFSAGQKQLICLARALVSRKKILILDEATADMDKETDRVINKVVMTSFSGCTVVIIAHRLCSILSCDRVLVLQAGRMEEYDSPDVLSHREGGLFRNMLQDAGLLK